MSEVGEGQGKLFDQGSSWEETWIGMPEFVNEDQTSVKAIKVHFETWDDLRDFAEIVDQKIGDRTKSIWYPAVAIGDSRNKIWIDSDES